MGHVVIRNEQAVFVGGGIGVSCTIQRISVHRPHVGEGHIVQGAVCLGAAVKGAVHRAGNAHAGEVKIISATGGEGKLLFNRLFNRQRNVCEITCVIGIIIAVILFAEDLQGIAARCNVRRDFDFNRSAFGSRLCYSAIIPCAAAIRNDGGDIFIYPCGRPFVIQRNGIAGVAADSFFRYGKTAATI